MAEANLRAELLGQHDAADAEDSALADAEAHLAATHRTRSRQSTQAATAKRSARAKQRQMKLALRRPAASGPSPLGDTLTSAQEFSVSGPQLKRYLEEADECLEWCRRHPSTARLNLKNHSDLDSAGNTYLDKLFNEGEEAAAAKAVVFGLILRRGLPKAKTSLPKCRKSLAGFEKEFPPGQRDPPPEEACFLVAADLLIQDLLTPGGDILALTACAAMFCQLDLGGRPSETLALTRDRIIPPQGAKFPRHAVMFQPHPNAVVEKGAAKNSRPSKQGQFDDTVFSGLDGSPNGVFTKLLQVLHAQARPGESLFSPLTLEGFERQIKLATHRTDLRHLEICPHGFRHAMASKALLHGLLDAKQLMARLRVTQMATVRRYGKDGKLQRQMQLLGPAKRLTAEGMISAKNFRNPAVALVSRLASLKRMRLDRGL
jgi:hypothetical protein